MLLEHVLAGGPIMIPLLALSMIGLTILLERALFWFGRRGRTWRRELMLATTGRLPLDTRARSPLVLQAAVAARNLALDGVEQAVHAEGAAGLGLLDHLGVIATTLGFLGTLFGLVMALRAHASGDAHAFFHGFAVSIYTTIGGAVVNSMSLAGGAIGVAVQTFARQTIDAARLTIAAPSQSEGNLS